jgi:transcriptional regulator with XRE-family HTH domain
VSERFVLPRIITALRESKGLNQSQLAAELDVSPSAANQVENDEHGVQETVFVRYATACGFPDELSALEAGVRALRKKERASGNGEAKPAPAKPKPAKPPAPKAAKPAPAKPPARPTPARSSKRPSTPAKRTRSKRSKPARAAR